MLGLCDHVLTLLKGPASLLEADPAHQHMLGCNSCAAKTKQDDYKTVHLSYVGDESIVLQGELSQSTEKSHVKSRLINFHQVYTQ